MQPDSKTPAPNSQHPQAKALGKNKFNKSKADAQTEGWVGVVRKNPVVAPPPPPVESAPAPPAAPVASPVAAVLAALAAVTPAPKLTPPKESAASPPSEPGKDQSFFELTIKLVGSEEPPFTVETPLTGNGAADKHNATSVAKKKYAGRAMTIVSSRIYTRTENSLTEIAPGSTLSALFGAPGEVTGDLIEIGKAFNDGSRGTIFLRNMRTFVGVTFRPSSGGLIVYSNRIASNRLASELPLIVAEVLGNNAREIEIYLKP